MLPKNSYASGRKVIFHGVKRTFHGAKRIFHGVKRTFRGVGYKLVWRISKKTESVTSKLH